MSDITWILIVIYIIITPIIWYRAGWKDRSKFYNKLNIIIKDDITEVKGFGVKVVGKKIKDNNGN